MPQNPSKLNTILDALTSVESQLIPIFIHNPTSQKVAAIAFVGEQYAIALFKSLQASQPAPAPAPAASALSVTVTETSGDSSAHIG